MGAAADDGAPDERSALADAIGGAAFAPARVAARAWRGPLETAAEEILSTREVRQDLDQALAGSLPEELGRRWCGSGGRAGRNEFAASGELERLLDSALGSPRTLQVLDRCSQARR